jgi:DNA-binding CsgD family transcriptional regulator
VGALVERESELAVLGGVVEGVLAGTGGAVLIEGEPGIGKTRLLTWARERAAGAGVRVLYGTADEIEGSVPLAGARVLLGRAARELDRGGPAQLGLLALEGGLAEPGGLGSRRDEVIHALWWLIVELADACPLALLLDDAQWADEVTLRLLRLAARRAPELPLALVVTARPARPGQRHGGLAAEPAFMRLEPVPLSVAGAARLIEATLGRPGPDELAERARAVTGGNPLYLRVLLEQGGAEGVEAIAGSRAPPQLVRLVADRLERLTPAGGALASAVAILGADADAARARALAGLEAREALAAEEELWAERVLDWRSYAFTHPLVAAAVREAMPATQAGELHQHAAELLAEAGADDERVAEHLLRAPPRGDASVVAVLRRAAEAGRRAGAPMVAARLLERALAEPPPAAEVGALEFERGRALVDAGADDGARVLGRLARQATAAPVRAAAARHLARQLVLDDRGGDAAALLRAALATLPEPEHELRLELLVELAFVANFDLAGHDAARAVTAEAARSRWRTPGERLVTVAARVLRAAPPADPVGAAVELLGMRLHRHHPGGFAVGRMTFSAAAILLNADAPEEAERAMDALRADAEEMRLPDLIAGALSQQAEIAYQRGDLTRCEMEARAASEASRDVAGRLATPWRVMALAEQDRLGESERLLGTAGMLGAIPDSFLWTAALGSRGRLRLAQGDPRAAAEDLANACDRSSRGFARGVEPAWRPLLTEALVLAGRSTEAAAEAEAYAALAVAWGTHRALGHAARMRALASPRAQAIALLEQAREHFARSHAKLELARCLTELGAHRRAAGDRRAARAILRDAHDVAHACGASGLCRRARAELLLAGGRPRPATGVGADALTPAEQRVAELAAGGATNREIARRLYLSPKTVEMHLRSAYRKLDLRGRDELPAALA